MINDDFIISLMIKLGRHLPAALLHLLSSDWLCPKAFTTLANATQRTLLVAPGTAAASFAARPHCQIQRGRHPDVGVAPGGERGRVEKVEARSNSLKEPGYTE